MGGTEQRKLFKCAEFSFVSLEETWLINMYNESGVAGLFP